MYLNLSSNKHRGWFLSYKAELGPNAFLEFSLKSQSEKRIRDDSGISASLRTKALVPMKVVAKHLTRGYRDTAPW